MCVIKHYSFMCMRCHNSHFHLLKSVAISEYDNFLDNQHFTKKNKYCHKNQINREKIKT